MVVPLQNEKETRLHQTDRPNVMLRVYPDGRVMLSQRFTNHQQTNIYVLLPQQYKDMYTFQVQYNLLVYPVLAQVPI